MAERSLTGKGWAELEDEGRTAVKWGVIDRDRDGGNLVGSYAAFVCLCCCCCC